MIYKVVGAIKDGAKATNDLMNYKYSAKDSTGVETLKNKPNIFNASVSYNKSESKSSVHNETVEKSSLVSGRNMNIKSKNGSITISGTDVKVGNDLDLSAKKDITIKASEENFTSSSSSSQMGIGLSADLSKGKIADLSISKAGTRGRGNGTNYINSTIDVGGKLKTNSKNLTLFGANVEADKLDIKAQNVVIESKQDKSEREDSSYGGSFSIDLANPSSFSANINGSKGNGEKEWVNKQTTLIARNGGKIDTDSLTNIGAVIGSESEKEKLKVSANKVIVKDLEDKNKYENIGGGITIGTALTSTKDTKGDFLERYKQASMMRAIGDQVEKNPEYLSILDKKTIKDGKIDDETQVEQVSVMNRLLNDALRAKGYKGPDVKMVLTDVTDPNGPYYTDTLTNTVVFDRKELAKANRDQILNALGHEFGHYSKEDDIDKSQDIANHTGKLLEDRTKDMVAKEATEDTLAAIRNNKNIITGEEGKKLADSIPMDRREYYEQAEIQISGRFLFFGGSISAGFIYNKDEKTGKREYGYTASLQGSLGPAFPSVGVSIRRHEERGKPIEKFKGGYGGVSIGGGVGIIGEYEMEVNDVDYVEHSVSVSLGSPSAFAMGNLGWRFVANAKDARMQKLIKLTTENSNEIEQAYDYYDKYKSIRDERNKWELKWEK